MSIIEKNLLFFSAKSIGIDKISVHIQYYGRQYKIVFTPGVHKMISSISEKSKRRFQRKRVSKDVFDNLKQILGEFSRNPDRYGLSELKAFKK